MNYQSLNKGILLVAMVAFAIDLAIASADSELPKQFLISAVKIQLVSHCPWDHRRTYSVNGFGEFEFIEVARSEDPTIEDQVREQAGLADIGDVGHLLILLLESSFQFLPETIDEVSYSLRDDLVREDKITISTFCDAQIALEIGYWEKTVNYKGSRFLPREFVQYFQEIVGEHES